MAAWAVGVAAHPNPLPEGEGAWGFDTAWFRGNPGAVEGCYSDVSPLHPAWIPAFAGMTISGGRCLSRMGF